MKDRSHVFIIKKLQSHFYNKKFTILENGVWVVTRNSMCSKNSCFFDEKFWFANLQKVYPSWKNGWDTKRAFPTKKMSYQHMFDSKFTKVCFYTSSWDVIKCSFMSITETYTWFFIIGFYLRVVKMRFSLNGILDIQEARRHLYFSRKTSRKYIFSMSVLNLWVDFTKVLFEEKSVLRMQLNRASFPISKYCKYLLMIKNLICGFRIVKDSGEKLPLVQENDFVFKKKKDEGTSCCYHSCFELWVYKIWIKKRLVKMQEKKPFST